MSVFRLQDNTPEIYQSSSRDFQLLSRAMDAIHGGVMNDIISMKNVIRPRRIYDSMLVNYSSRVGFFPKRSIDAKVLRYILAAFPYIIKKKGTKDGIREAVITVTKAENNILLGDDVSVDIDNVNYTIDIKTPYDIYNRNALEELLAYVIPTGYDYTFTKVVRLDPVSDTFVEGSKIKIVTATPFASGARPVSEIPSISSDYEESSFNSAFAYGVNIKDFEDISASSYTTNAAVSVTDAEATKPQDNNTPQNLQTEEEEQQ